MARFVTPGQSQPDGGGSFRFRPFFVIDLVRRYGVGAVYAIFFAALFAFAPLATLYWFAELRLQPVVTTELGRQVVVKSAQTHEEQEHEKPGETALLQVTCDIPVAEGWQELLRDGDKAHTDSMVLGSNYVRRERVYVRRVGSKHVPFGLLGPPPVSVWLPAGNYEILVIYEAPTGESRIDAPGKSFPWLSEFADCSLESRTKTVCRIRLPHYDRGNPDALLGIGSSAGFSDQRVPTEHFAELLASCETAVAIPTPAGYVLQLEEPEVNHHDAHRGCFQDFQTLHSIPREWTRSQLVSLRNWLPPDATRSRERLTTLVDQLGWRQFLEGWFCIAAAGISGLVFTRWGALNLLEPWRRRQALREIPGLLVKIFFLSVVAWIVIQFISDVTGLHHLERG